MVMFRVFFLLVVASIVLYRLTVPVCRSSPSSSQLPPLTSERIQDANGDV